MTLIARLNARLGFAVCLLGLTVAVPVIACAIAPAPAEARAGGSYGGSSGGSRSSFSGGRSSYSGSSRGYAGTSHGSRGGSGGGSLGGFLSFLGFAAVGLTLLLFFSSNKPAPAGRLLGARSEARLDSLLAAAAAQDGAWREEALLQHARDAFEAVQCAWVARNQDLARAYMTDAMYDRHRQQTDAMIARGEKNVLAHLAITAARIVHLVDRVDDAKDQVWVQFTARAEDYLINEHTGAVLKGAKGEIHVFKEIWKFRRDGRTWKLDAIAPHADQALPPSYRDATA